MGKRARTVEEHVRRAEVALRELDLSALTRADTERVSRARTGLIALDEDQALLRGAIDDLCEEYDNPNAPDDDCARLVRALREIVDRPARLVIDRGWVTKR